MHTMRNLHGSTIFPNIIQVLPSFPNDKLFFNHPKFPRSLLDYFSTWTLFSFSLSTRDSLLFSYLKLSFSLTLTPHFDSFFFFMGFSIFILSWAHFFSFSLVPSDRFFFFNTLLTTLPFHSFSNFLHTPKIKLSNQTHPILEARQCESYS